METNILKRCPLPELDFDRICLGHGSGGYLTNKLLEEVVFKLFEKDSPDQHDGTIVDFHGKMAISTDSFVVTPIFFPGGNIGDLAMHGTMNDLAMCGAIPKYMSLSLILEEGLLVTDLWRVLVSMQAIAHRFDVQIVTGDTKVVEKGKGDKMYINTTGLGEVMAGADVRPQNIQAGDHVLLSGPVASHGVAIMSVREGLAFETPLQSDTKYVGEISGQLVKLFGDKVHFMRDPTRGGLATVLNEVAGGQRLCIELHEEKIPVLPAARHACEMLGLDPLYVANEGVFVAIVAPQISGEALSQMRQQGFDAACRIGEVTQNYPGKVLVQTAIGGRRAVPMLMGEQLPRIC